jgi:hypothetical protein
MRWPGHSRCRGVPGRRVRPGRRRRPHRRSPRPPGHRHPARGPASGGPARVWRRTPCPQESPRPGSDRGRWPTTAADTAPGRSAPGPWARRTPQTPPPGCSRSFPPCPCTAAGPRPSSCLSSRTQSHPQSAPHPGAPGAWPRNHARHLAPGQRPSARCAAAAASHPGCGAPPIRPATSSSCVRCPTATRHECPRRPPQLHPAKPAPHPPHQLIEHRLPRGKVHTASGNHCKIINSPHNS